MLKISKLNYLFHPLNFIKINSYFTITLEKCPKIDFNKNLKI